MSLERSIGRFRRRLYRTASVLGDVQAASSGSPRKVGQRIVRKAMWRTVGKALAGILTGR